MQTCRVLKRRKYWRESSDLVVNTEGDNRGIETAVWMKTVCIRTINGSVIHKQAMSSNRVSKEDRSTFCTRNVHLRVVTLLALRKSKGRDVS